MSVHEHSMPDLVIPDGLTLSNALPIPEGALFINLFGQPDVDAQAQVLVNPIVPAADKAPPTPAAPGTGGWTRLTDSLDVTVLTPGSDDAKPITELGKMSGSMCLFSSAGAVIGDNTWKANATWSGSLFA